MGGRSAAVSCCLAAMLARGHCARVSAMTSWVPGFAPAPPARPKRTLAHMPTPHRALGTQLRSINALTLCTHDMRKACDFYAKLGLVTTFGGPDAVTSVPPFFWLELVCPRSKTRVHYVPQMPMPRPDLLESVQAFTTFSAQAPVTPVSTHLQRGRNDAAV